MRHCEFLDIGIEHGSYDNIEGGETLFKDCKFSLVGAQGLKFVYRSSESPRPQDPVDGTNVTVKGCVFTRCTSPYVARASSTIDMVHMNRGLVVDGCALIAGFPPNQGGDVSRGAIVAEGLPNVLLYDTLVDYAQPGDRPVIQLHDNRGPLVIKDCVVKAGMVSVRKNVAHPLVVHGCHGDAQLWVNGSHVGRLDAGYSA